MRQKLASSLKHVAFALTSAALAFILYISIADKELVISSCSHGRYIAFGLTRQNAVFYLAHRWPESDYRAKFQLGDPKSIPGEGSISPNQSGKTKAISWHGILIEICPSPDLWWNGHSLVCQNDILQNRSLDFYHIKMIDISSKDILIQGSALLSLSAIAFVILLCFEIRAYTIHKGNRVIGRCVQF